MENKIRIDELYRELYEKHKDMDDEELLSWWSDYQAHNSWYDGMSWIGACVCEDILTGRGNKFLDHYRP